MTINPMKSSQINKQFVSLLALAICLSAIGLGGCKSTPPSEQPTDQTSGQSAESAGSDQESAQQRGESPSAEKIQALPPTSEEPPLEIATFAGGCFWCVEPPFDKVKGVERTIVGYTGGEEQHPTYEEVASGKTSHAEAIRVYYDPDEVSYDKLLDIFWRNINPTQENGQFVDIGDQYRTAIFVHDEDQERLAKASKEELDASGRFDKPIVTEIEQADTFWRAEEYHQDFYMKSPGRYKSYRSGSGRDEFIERIWSDD